MKTKWPVLIGFIILCNLIGALGALWTSADSEWYQTLAKPSFNPPSWVFGPVWTVLFTLMGIALYYVWVARASPIRTNALILFVAQFVLNILWSYLFFGINNPFASFIDIIVLELVIILTIIVFYHVDKKAGYLLVPYALWVAFASFLNYSLWVLNR